MYENVAIIIHLTNGLDALDRKNKGCFLKRKKL